MAPDPGYAFTNLPKISQADASRWVGVEPPELPFTIEDLVPEGMTTLLVGHGGAGKSLVAQLALTCCPTGNRFLGKLPAAGNGAGIFAEDPEAVLHIRQVRINDVLGIDMEVLVDRLFIQSYAGVSALLWENNAPTAFMAELEGELNRIHELRLVVLDNVALLFAGNENDRLEVTAFINALNGMAARLCVGLILTTHASKSQDGSALRAASGSTAWINACRSVLELRQAEGEEGPMLRVIKANHVAAGSEIGLEWRDGVLVSAEMDTPTIAGIKTNNAEKTFLELLDLLGEQGRGEVSPKPSSSTYAPKIMMAMPERDGLKRRDLERAMDRLFSAGEIVATDYGPASRGWKKIVRARK